ncbi:MAG: hypothetical protein H6753_01830 [Candidatus Omnitrophica bacterium]|nr:hypothetical protein [Candidatus Omnitrophota bacterium]
MPMNLKVKNPFAVSALAVVAAIGGSIYYLSVCVRHFLSQRPLWLDESMVFESVQNFAPTDFFTQRLAAGQIFPKLYLFLIQRVAQPFELNLLSVRLLSFVAMISAFAVWMKIASYELKDRWAYLTYVLSWAGSSLLVYYSAELKPYSMDVLAAGLFVLFLYHADQLFQEKSWVYFFSIGLLPLLGMVSYTAFLFYIFLFYHLLIAKKKDGFWWQCVLSFSIAAVVSLGWVYYFDIRLAQATTNSQGFSDHIVSFASVGEFFKTWGEGTLSLFGRFFAERPRVIKKMAVPFAILGFGYMFYTFFKSFFSQGYRLTTFRTMALVLYGELFILGALQKYPFSVPRTSLFFCPIVFLLIVDAIMALRQGHKNSSIIIHAAYIGYLLIVAFGIGREAWSGYLGFAPLIF